MSKAGWRRWITAVAITAGATLCFRFPDAAAGGVSRGLSLCGQVLIPTLFPLLVFSTLLIRSGVAAAVGRRLEGVTRRLFGLPGCAAPAILMAFLGGYPAGAAAIAQLRKRQELTVEEGRRMLRFCVAGGPGFVVGAVGVGMTGYLQIGWILLAAQLLSALILGITAAPRAARRSPAVFTRTVAPDEGAAAFTRSVESATETLLSTCGFVLLFSAVLSLLDATALTASLPPSLAAVIPCLLEVSNGCLAAAHSGRAAPFLLGFAVCFGGVSVHCQIAAVLSHSGVMSPTFFLSRLVHGLLGGGITTILFAVVELPLSVFGGHGAPRGEWMAVDVGVSAAMLLLCGVWLMTVLPKSVDGTVEI